MTAALFFSSLPPSRHSHPTSLSSSIISSSNSLQPRQQNYAFSPCSSRAFPQEPRCSSGDIQEQGFGVSLSGNPSLVKMPTPPWMGAPLVLPAKEVLDLSRSRREKTKPKGDSGQYLTERVKGGRGRQAMRKIVRSISKLQKLHPKEMSITVKTEEFQFADFDAVMNKIGDECGTKIKKRVPWARAEKIVFPRMKRERVITAAELTIDKDELERLRSEAVKIKKWITVKKAGVTEAVVREIKGRWRDNELAMVKFDVPLCRNMERAHEILETKTGGLVVWRKKETAVVYRGHDFRSQTEAFPTLLSNVNDKDNFLASRHEKVGDDNENSSSSRHEKVGNDIENFSSSRHEKVGDDNENSLSSRHEKVGNDIKNFSSSRHEKVGTGDNLVMGQDDCILSINGSLYEREGDRLLHGLGPRFIDWWGPKPLPVDADLLPEVVPAFRPPFRLCPPHTRRQLTDDELTYLRRIARPLPTHFVLGRNSRLQGLASAILKLWERCHIVKIAVKYGSPNTNNEKMAYELKLLTGGVLLLRNKYYIIMYRGKDFLPCKVASMIFDREAELKIQQHQEERARLMAVESCHDISRNIPNSISSGSLSEFLEVQKKIEFSKDKNWPKRVQIEAEKENLEKELRNEEQRLSILNLKIERSEKVVAKLEWRPSVPSADREILTEEEKQMLRRIGLKMSATLVLGRRGIYDGVIGSIHQHWKHREVVKVITMQTNILQISNTARLLEIESGGVLVSVEKLKRGHAIIIYRGKNYQRPLKLQPENLPGKREALLRSIEMQRRGSLKFFAHQKQLKIRQLKRKLATWQFVSTGNRRTGLRCIYSGSGEVALLYGAGGFVTLAVAMLVQHAYIWLAVSNKKAQISTPTSAGNFTSPHSIINLFTSGAAVVFLLAWVCFAVTEVLLLIGIAVESIHLKRWREPRDGCVVVRQWSFLAAGVFDLTTVIFATSFYLLVLRMKRQRDDELAIRNEVIEADNFSMAAAPLPPTTPSSSAPAPNPNLSQGDTSTISKHSSAFYN